MDSIWQQLLLQLILILINAFFAATEIAVISLNPTRLRKMADEGDKSAPRLLKLLEAPAGFLSTIQIGITLAGFLGSAFAADNFSEYLVRWVYDDLGFTALSPATLDTLSVIVITLILSYFTLVLGELVPKRIAMQKPMEVARVSCRVVSALSVVMKPVVWFLSVSTNGLLRLLGMRTEAQDETVTEDEIRMMVELGGEKGTIDENEQAWIQNVFAFGDTTVREIMTHEADVVAFPIDTPDAEIVRVIRESGLSRYPVYDEDINDIQGILNARDFLMNQSAPEPQSLEALLRPAYFVPETLHADQLFKDMQREKHHFTVVIDEYGQTSGIVTMEDLLEEIVGNIYDEFDPAEPPEIQQLEENLWRVSGSAPIADVVAALGVPLPDEVDYDTLGGMVLSCLRTIPEDGTTLDVQVNGLDIHVLQIAERRIETALVRKLPSAPDGQGAPCANERTQDTPRQDA
nr:hemolysin family protein [Maliibacterium massiliense]